MIKKTINYLLLGTFVLFLSCNQSSEKQAQKNAVKGEQDKSILSESLPGKPEYLTVETFKQKVWDYDTNPEEWVYIGELPAIVDFYADWCKPCRMIAPIMEDIAAHYKGRLKVYKVDTEAHRELASVFQIRSIPLILFAPLEGKPAMQPGALSKEEYMRIIEEFVLKSPDENPEHLTEQKNHNNGTFNKRII